MVIVSVVVRAAMAIIWMAAVMISVVVPVRANTVYLAVGVA